MCTDDETTGRAMIANWATATIWRYHCDPINHYNMYIYMPDGYPHLSYRWRMQTTIELGNVIDELAKPMFKRLLGVERILIANEKGQRKCREIECDHCHGAK